MWCGSLTGHRCGRKERSPPLRRSLSVIAGVLAEKYKHTILAEAALEEQRALTNLPEYAPIKRQLSDDHHRRT